LENTITPVKSLQRGDTNISLGSLVSYTKKTNGIDGTTTCGSFRITFYSEWIIRIRIVLEEFEEDFSYAVISGAKDIEFALEEINSHILLSTKSVILRIEKDPVRFSFLNVKGQVICEDDPSFGTSWIGDQVTTYKKLQEGERFIGLGEKTGPLDRRGKGYQNWNKDVFGYGINADPIYSSIPFYIGIHDNIQYGIFLDNTYKSHFNFGASNNRFSSFSADSGEMNYYFIYGETVSDVITHYTTLTGRMPLPPLWSLGYQQCRYSYYPDTEVIRIADTFRVKDIPADAIVLDIHHMDEYKIFSWDNHSFPNPARMISDLKNKGFHTVVICDPGIKNADNYPPFSKGIEKDIFLKFPDGSCYSGEVWPGWCYFPDFSMVEAREFWGELFKSYTDAGVEGFWNDMNEIATWGQMMPELVSFSFEGRGATLRRMKNVYGLLMAKSTYQGTKKLLRGKRPFNLSRSGFSGIQRYAALWTGDNTASDEHMMLGVRLVNSLGVSGVPFTGNDVGGFAGDATPELFARWISIGAFTPFFRAHSIINSRNAEPWTFGERVMEISRNYIKLRYHLLPYIYSLFFKSSRTGLPISRTLAIDYPHESRVYDHKYQNQFMFGDNILVAPVESTSELARIFIPQGQWFDMFTDSKVDGNSEIIIEAPLEKLPLFIKSSSIIPVQSDISSTSERPEKLLEIHFYDGDMSSEFIYYEDDGDTFDYEKGIFYKRRISFNPKERKILLQKPEGKYKTWFSTLRIFFHGFSALENVSINEKLKEIESCEYRFVNPISNFDPVHMMVDNSLVIKDLPWVEFENLDQVIEISW